MINYVLILCDLNDVTNRQLLEQRESISGFSDVYSPLIEKHKVGGGGDTPVESALHYG